MLFPGGDSGGGRRDIGEGTAGEGNTASQRGDQGRAGQEPSRGCPSRARARAPHACSLSPLPLPLPDSPPCPTFHSSPLPEARGAGTGAEPQTGGKARTQPRGRATRSVAGGRETGERQATRPRPRPQDEGYTECRAGYTACSSETPPKRATGAGQTGPHPARPRPRPSRGLGVSPACPLALWHEACTLRGVPR